MASQSQPGCAPKSATSDAQPSAAFPVPEFTDIAVALGASRSDYLTREEMGDDLYSGYGRHCNAARMLFFKGGKLSDFGLCWKAEINGAKAMRALRAWLGSWDPKHEIKIGTVGYALSQWCDDIADAGREADVTATGVSDEGPGNISNQDLRS
jgi:hypothetical protein